MLILTMTFALSTVGFSQVKDKFRDSTNTSTIVVIKEDNDIDQDLLDQHFDLNSMSMSDQIMITTRPEPLPMEDATASINDDIEVFFDEVEEEETTAEVSTEEVSTAEVNTAQVNTAEVAKNNINVQSKKEEKKTTIASAKNTVKSAPTRARGNYPTKCGYEVKKAAQKKYYAKSKVKKRKKKSKKRRLFKRKKSQSCYSF